MTSSAQHPYFATRSTPPESDPLAPARFAALADQVAESETLTLIARQIAGAANDRGATFDLLANGAVSLLGADGALVALLEERGEFCVQAAAGALRPMHGFSAPIAGSLAEEALACFHPLVLNDASGDPRVDAHFLGAFSPRQAVVAPMVVTEAPRGFLLALNSSKGFFAPADAALLQRLADHGAIAVRHGELLAQTEQAAREARALSDIVQEINQSLELERVVTLLARHATNLLGGRGARVGVLDAHQITTSATFGDAADRIGAVYDVTLVFAGEAVRLRRAVHTTDLRPYADQWARTGKGASLGEGRANGVAAPLLVGGRAIGAVTVFGRESGEFTDRDGVLLQALANHAAVAIENARLYRAAAYTARHASILAATSRALALHSSSDTVYKGMSEIVTDSLGANGFSVYLADPETRRVEKAYTQGPGSLQQMPDVLLAFWTMPSGKTVLTGEPLYLSDVDDIFAGISPPPSGVDIKKYEMRSIAMLPLVSDGRTQGLLTIRFAHRRKFEEHERRLLEDFSTQVAVAVRNAQTEAAEQAGRERERMLATALATMEHPVFVLTPDARVQYANPAAAREYQYSVDELTGSTLETLIATKDVHRRRDGSEFPVTVGVSQILDEHRAVVGEVVSVRNTTEERQLQEAMHQTEKLAALGELVAGVAHELNNPLTGISTFAQLLLEDDLGDDQLESVRTIKRESDRAVAVIRDLLVFSRKTGPQHGPVNLEALVQQTMRLRSYALQSTGITIGTEFEPDLPTVSGDDRKLQQVLLNLIVNAEYAMHRSEPRRLTVRTLRLPGAVAIEIKDTGAGMAPEVVKHIFEPFYTTKPVGVGTGLGLSVSYGIVQAHGGTIGVESTVGVGTTFRITLPQGS